MPNIAAEEQPGTNGDSRVKIIIQGEVSGGGDAPDHPGQAMAEVSVMLAWNVSSLPFDHIAGVQPLPGRPLIYPEWLSRDDSGQHVTSDPHVQGNPPQSDGASNGTGQSQTDPAHPTGQPGAGASAGTPGDGASNGTGQPQTDPAHPAGQPGAGVPATQKDSAPGNGNDIVFGKNDFAGGDHVIDLKDGDDIFYGTSVAEKVQAGKGNDVVYSGGGADSINMEADDDRAVLAGGELTVTGGDGIDMLDLGAIRSGVKVDFGPSGNGNMVSGDSMTLVSGFEQVLGGSGADSIIGDDLTNTDGNLLIGEDGDDVIEGRGGADILIGGPGADLLYGDRPEGGPLDAGDKIYGAAGDDTLMGNDGDDVINGGSGSDLLYGGAGSDVFEFEDPAESQSDRPDLIRDFEKTDKLDFSSFMKQGDTFSVTSDGGFTTLSMDAYHFAIKFEGTFESTDFQLVS